MTGEPSHGTRMLFAYNLANQLKVSSDAGTPLHTLYDFGRFTPHFHAAEDLLPRVIINENIPAEQCGGLDHLLVDRCKIVVTVTTRGDMTLLLDVLLPSRATADDVTAALMTTCFYRENVLIEDKILLTWVEEKIVHYGFNVENLRFGRDVHQMVFPRGALLDEIRLAFQGNPDVVPPLVSQIIYRGNKQIASGIRIPVGLNNPGHTLLAHGRGVLVAAGWGEQVAVWGAHIENTFAVVAMNLLSALGVLQRARRHAFSALSLNDRAALQSMNDSRKLVARLSSDLNEIQLDLSFGVEAYIDSVLIPESVVEDFQSSLRESFGLNEGLHNTSRMLTRLQSVLQARLSNLEASVSEQRERSNRVFSGVLAIGTLIALPPALLLAFFGLNGTEVSDQRSIFDFGAYWPAYAVAWLPFMVLAAAGFILQRRITRRLPQTRQRQ